MRIPKRRYHLWSLASIALVAALLLAGCGKPAPQGPLIMYDWSGYELPEFWTEFAEKYPDVEVEFSFMSESADVYPKLQSGYTADLVHPCNQYWELLVDEGLVQPIDTAKLSHWSELNERFIQEGQFDGKQYWVPWEWGFEAILVRTDLVEEVPDEWIDLWDPQYAGHVALYDSGETMHIITALALGLDPWATTPEEDAMIKEKMKELVPNVLAYWSDQTELDQMVASGDVWVAANAWNASYTALLGEGHEVAYISPAEGALGYLCGFAIPTNAKYVELAHAMIDAYIAAESQAYLGNEYGYGTVNNEAISLLDPEMVELFGLTDPDTINSIVLYKGISAETREFWTNEWSEVKASQ